MTSVEHHGRPAHPDESVYALLQIDRTNLLVPSKDIRVLELAIDIERDDPPARGVGWIAFGQHRCPVYCPSTELEWLTEVPVDRTTCAVVEADGQVFGLLCDEATLLSTDEIGFHDVPAAMATPESPFHRLAIHARTLVCVSSAARILADLLSGQAHGESTPHQEMP